MSPTHVIIFYHFHFLKLLHMCMCLHRPTSLHVIIHSCVFFSRGKWANLVFCNWVGLQQLVLIWLVLKFQIRYILLCLLLLMRVDISGNDISFIGFIPSLCMICIKTTVCFWEKVVCKGGRCVQGYSIVRGSCSISHEK